jgi:hypothetical protein
MPGYSRSDGGSSRQGRGGEEDHVSRKRKERGDGVREGRRGENDRSGEIDNRKSRDGSSKSGGKAKVVLGPAMSKTKNMLMIVGLVVGMRDPTEMTEVGMMRDTSMATGVGLDTNRFLLCLAGVAGEATFVVEKALVEGGIALQLAGVGEGEEEGSEEVMRATGETSKATEADPTMALGIGVTALVQEQQMRSLQKGSMNLRSKWMILRTKSSLAPQRRKLLQK